MNRDVAVNYTARDEDVSQVIPGQQVAARLSQLGEKKTIGVVEQPVVNDQRPWGREGQWVQEFDWAVLKHL